MIRFYILKERIKRAWVSSRPRLASVVLGIFLVVAGFWVYTNFRSAVNNEVKIEKSDDSVTSPAVSPSTPNSGEKVLGTNSRELTQTELSNWVANDLVENSLKEEKTYTVKTGDTLWEIAEAKYGSGFEWYRLLGANKDKVGLLPNGEQTLIEPGQILNLP